MPATIGIIDGKIKVGLNAEEFEILARNDSEVPTIKTSRRDLAYVLSKKYNGGTTVAGTIIVANAVGIDVFATGGIGGVHRDGENTMDISADLNELGRSSVAVVSSGVKSILDIPRTLEYLVSYLKKKLFDKMLFRRNLLFLFLGNSRRYGRFVSIARKGFPSILYKKKRFKSNIQCG